MMLVRRSSERVRDIVVGQDAWLTFGPTVPAPFDAFGNLDVLREGRFARSASVSQIRDHAEIITYVYSGSLAFEDSRGLTGVLRQGEFQRMTAGPGLRYSEVNISPENEAHVFQFWLHPQQSAVHSGHSKRRFTVADRRGRLRQVASPGGLEGSLNIHQDASLYSAILSAGQYVIHPIGVGRGAWLHIVDGAARLGEVLLETGDGAGVSDEESVAIAVTEPTELLLLDMGNFGSKLTNENERPTIRPRNSGGTGTTGHPSHRQS